MASYIQQLNKMKFIYALQRSFNQREKICTYQQYKYFHQRLKNNYQCAYNMPLSKNSTANLRYLLFDPLENVITSRIPLRFPNHCSSNLQKHAKFLTQQKLNTVNLLGSCMQIHILHYVNNKKEEFPEYLQGIISTPTTIDQDLFDDEFDEDIQNELEDDIIEFLTNRAVIYEETDTSFIVQCPTCNHDECSTKAQDIFVDKNSGYFVCPWCYCAGSWEEFMEIIDSREDCLHAEQLTAFIDSTTPLSTAEALAHPILKNITAATLHHFKVALNSDGSRLIVPVIEKNGSIVGFESLSFINLNQKVIHRFLPGKAHCISHSELIGAKKIVVVSDAVQVMCLAEHNIPALSLPGDPELVKTTLRNGNHSEVILWLNQSKPPRHILMTCIEIGTSCSTVKLDDWHSPTEFDSEEDIKRTILKAQPLVYETIATFQQFKDIIYHRLTHKHEVNGIQWQRYIGLNNLLLGHRPGELTVLTGSTGSGKTTLMAEYSLDLCTQGVCTLWGTFEISAVRLCEIMLQQFHGKLLPEDEGEFNSLADDFSKLPLHFLTYHGQQSVDGVIKAMVDAVCVWGVQHVIIDNLQFMLGFNEKVMDRWWEQDRAVQAFRRFSTHHNCHLTLIVHPKKVPEGQDIGINSIFGGAKVTQEADNVLILQVKEGGSITQNKKSLQVVKNRYGGHLGVLPLRFHKESLTLSSFFTQKNKTEEKGQRETATEGNFKKQKRKVFSKGIGAFSS